NNTSRETTTNDEVAAQQAPEKSVVAVRNTPMVEKEKASSSKLVFKIPKATKSDISAGATDDLKNEVTVDDEAKPASLNVTPVSPSERSAAGGATKPVFAAPNETALNENNEQMPIAGVTTRLRNNPDDIEKKPIVAEIEAIDDDSIIKFKIPRERSTNDIIEDQITIKDETHRPSFSITKEKKNPGVQADQMPEGFKIAPIPVVPTPEAAPATPTPEKAEQAPVPASDFTQAAQKMAERGGVWERRGIAMKFLIEDPDLAYTPSQAAGIVGNLLGESGPEMHPGQSQIGGPAFGIVQWEGGRLLDLGAFAGKDQADFMTQLRFMKHEFLGKERTAFNAIKATANRKDAAIVTRKMYERPSVHRDEERAAYADAVGDAFNKEYQAILASRIPAAPEAQTDGILAGWPSTGEEAMELFNQCDPSWGEIKTPNGTRACNVSCGPTSVAMAVNALTDREVNPGEVIGFTNKNKMWLAGDKGTSFDGVINLGKNFGINGYQMQNFKDINAYKEVLQNGGMILVAGSGPVPFVAAPQAHFVLIRAVTTDGKFLVADPYPKTADTNTKSWDANQIINGTFGAVVFTK
ncbi:MAG: phage tail tip lysozyme, partial [Candidatus Saccharimonadales bacterium]